MTQSRLISRPSAALALGLAVLACPSLAQEKPGGIVLAAHALKGGVYYIDGGVSNTGFILGDKGVVLIDAQRTPDDARKQIAVIARITPKPIDQIILTHADPDHVGGLTAYPAGTPTYVQENTKSEMQASAIDPTAPPTYNATYRALIPYLSMPTIGSTETKTLDGVRMVLMYVAPAHTAGDLIVYLPAQKIVFGGDIITTNTGRFPVIHYGGSSLGWITSMKAMLALDADTYVSGHGPNETKAMLRARLKDVEERRGQVKTMVAAGKTLAEVEQALPEPGASPMFLNFTQTVYNELTKGYPPASPPWTNLIHK